MYGGSLQLSRSQAATFQLSRSFEDRALIGDTICSSWKEDMSMHAILPVQQFAFTHGKNATGASLSRWLLFFSRLSHEALALLTVDPQVAGGGVCGVATTPRVVRWRTEKWEGVVVDDTRQRADHRRHGSAARRRAGRVLFGV